ncbi:TolC family outer membrane protein [Thalassovita sp.]|uniref:TolC family outer membrane protein n=1 Tax=Thalassovita sp. TaxID=1979401 RepID=UPI0029DE8CEC|nr:TolC family outer membrane protein [Thalassovita sp.]
MAIYGIRKRIAATGVAVAMSVMVPFAVSAETLADALVSAYNNSGILEQQRAVLRTADEDVAIAVAALRPVLNWSSEIEYGSSRLRSASVTTPTTFDETNVTFNLAAEWLIWDFGRSKLTIEARKESVLAARQALVSAEQSILAQAVDAYMNVRSASENVALRENNVRVITEELRAAKDRFEVGEVTRTDVAQAEARLAAANSSYAQAQGDLVSMQEYFRQAVGRLPGQLQQPPSVPATAKTMAEAKAIAMRNHPDILQAQHQVTVAEMGVEITRASMQPTVSLNSVVSLEEVFDSTDFTKSYALGIEASGPIYQGGRLSAQLRRAIASRDATRAGLLQTTRAVERQVGAAFASLKVAGAARAAYDEQVRAATVAFRGVREEATLGSRTTLDVLNAEQELLNAKANLISARNSEHVAAYLLLQTMGLLTTQHLKLNVQRYDPNAYYDQVKSAPAGLSKQGRQLDRMLQGIGKK